MTSLMLNHSHALINSVFFCVYHSLYGLVYLASIEFRVPYSQRYLVLGLVGLGVTLTVRVSGVIVMFSVGDSVK